jgi:hypothetical protein
LRSIRAVPGGRSLEAFAEGQRMTIFAKSCPSCGCSFRRTEVVHSFRCLGLLRNAFKCPGCGVKVIWSKRPWRMLMGGMLLSLALAWLGALMGWDHGFEPEALCWAAACFTALGIGIAGMFSMRFELTATANQHLQATPR